MAATNEFESRARVAKAMAFVDAIDRRYPPDFQSAERCRTVAAAAEKFTGSMWEQLRVEAGVKRATRNGMQSPVSRETRQMVLDTLAAREHNVGHDEDPFDGLDAF